LKLIFKSVVRVVGLSDRVGLKVGERDVGKCEALGTGDGIREIAPGVDGTVDGTIVGTVVGRNNGGAVVVGTSEEKKEGETSGIFVHTARNSPQKAESEDEQENVGPSTGQPQVPPAF
jgi:hypothetical protein